MSDLKDQLQRTLGESYTIERELEGGGMARVFVARDQHLGRKVVVKTLADDSGVSVSAERFRREIRLAASLQQANIVPVHSAGDVDGVPYYTMPFVEGESLRAQMDKRGALDVREAVNILRDVARALAFAHERGVVHRDIKPENILLSGSTAVVTDFGIAKAIEASHSMTGATTLTQLGTLLGTPAYISPEQAAGDPHVDHLADIYSLGVVAYEMLAGVRPFTATATRALLAAHINEPPPPLATKRDGLPPRLASLVMRCLEKDPVRRPQDADEFLTELEGSPSPSAAFRDGDGRKPVIAVLPLTNMSASADDEYFADGTTEDIIAQLSQIASLKVISRASVMGYKKSTQKPREIAAELGASHLIAGSVRRAGDRVRIVAQLMEANSEAHLWSETFDRDLTDIFGIQSELAERISAALVARLSPAEARRLAKRPTSDMEAYNLYLLGRQEYNSASPEAFARAEQYYDQAIARDPGFARAYAAKALVPMYHGAGYWGVRPREAWDRAVTLARTAIELDPDVGEAHMVLGAFESWFTYDWAASERHFSRAIALNPSHAFTRIVHGLYLFSVGRIEDALQSAQVAIELDPAAPLIHGNALAFLHVARRHEEFDAALVAARRLAPMGMNDLIVRAFQSISLGRAGEILPEMRGAGEVSNSVMHAWCAAAAGAEDEARVILRKLRALEQTQYVWATGLALTYAHLGESEKAFEYLEQAYQDRAGWMNHVGCHPAFDVFRGEPRFDDIIKRVGAVVPPEVARQRYKPMPVRRTASTAAVSERRSVAVLPFANLSPDPENEFFADGITDDLIAQVAKIGSLRIIARTSVMRYRGVQDAARTAAKELGVSAVVEGTVRRAGKRARIVAQLIDPSSDAPIWSETYDRDLDDVFSVQTEVATSLAFALRTTLTPTEHKRLGAGRPIDAESYDLYLLARHHANKRNDDGIRKGIAYFEQCISREPRFAAAHAGLADAYVFAGIGYATFSQDDAHGRGRAAADAAVAIDASSPEGLCALGLCHMFYEWAPARARTVLERAIVHNPNHAPAHQWLAWAQFSLGDYIGAVRTQELALQLDPLSVTLVTESGWPFTYAGLHDHAQKRYLRALELDPAFSLARYNLGLTYHGQGRYADAISAYEASSAGLGRVAWLLSWIGITYVAAGERDKAEAILGELKEQSRTDVRAWLQLAVLLDAMGKPDEALSALERAIETRSSMAWVITLEGYFPLQNIRSTPRFKAVLARLGAEPHDLPRQRALLLEHEQA